MLMCIVDIYYYIHDVMLLIQTYAILEIKIGFLFIFTYTKLFQTKFYSIETKEQWKILQYYIFLVYFDTETNILKLFNVFFGKYLYNIIHF